MKLLVVGLGSMGKRRINLLQKHFEYIKVCGVDTSENRRKQTEDLYCISTYEDLSRAIETEQPSAALVCTSPSSHGQIILDCIEKKLHIFSEINLLHDRYQEILKKAQENEVELFLSSTLMYRKEIEIIKEEVHKQESKLNYRYHIGQYLPDWHPWENYKSFFVGNKKTNGCREIFAIDLPWIIDTFGKVSNISVVKDNLSSLDLDYPDNYIVVLSHENGNKGVLMVDVVARKAVRELLVYSENLHLSWSGTPQSLSKYNIETKTMETLETYQSIERDRRYADNIIENAYLEELDVFIQKITNGLNKEKYTFQDDKYTLKLIDRIEGI